MVEGPRAFGGVLAHLPRSDRIHYLCAGPSYGTALFGAAKLLEEVPMCSVPQHLEEWAHLEYFLTMVEGARTRAVVVAPPSASTDRAVEVLQAFRADGGVAITVTHPRQDPVRHAGVGFLPSGGH